MSKNLINDESYEYTEGVAKTTFDALAQRVTDVEGVNVTQSGQISANAADILALSNKSTLLFSGDITVGADVVLSEDVRNFRLLMFVARVQANGFSCDSAAIVNTPKAQLDLLDRASQSTCHDGEIEIFDNVENPYIVKTKVICNWQYDVYQSTTKITNMRYFQLLADYRISMWHATDCVARDLASTDLDDEYWEIYGLNRITNGT